MQNSHVTGVEVVVAPLIVNNKGEILLVKSHKWGDVYLIPGGHLELNEKIFDCAKREGEEETGLKIKPLYCVNVGELINDPNFHRKAHLIYFHIVCEVMTENVQLDNIELQEYLWIKPEEALEKLNIVKGGVVGTIKNYINGTKINVCSDVF